MTNKISLKNKYIVLIALLILSVLLQTTVLSAVRIFDSGLLFIIPLAVCMGLFQGSQIGAVFGLCLGFVIDCTVSEDFGYYSFFLLMAGLLAGLLGEYLVVRHFVAASFAYIMVFALSVATNFLLSVFVFADLSSFAPYAKGQAISALVNAVFMPVAYLLSKKMALLYAEEDDVKG